MEAVSLPEGEVLKNDTGHVLLKIRKILHCPKTINC